MRQAWTLWRTLTLTPAERVYRRFLIGTLSLLGVSALALAGMQGLTKAQIVQPAIGRQTVDWSATETGMLPLLIYPRDDQLGGFGFVVFAAALLVLAHQMLRLNAPARAERMRRLHLAGSAQSELRWMNRIRLLAWSASAALIATIAYPLLSAVERLISPRGWWILAAPDAWYLGSVGVMFLVMAATVVFVAWRDERTLFASGRPRRMRSWLHQRSDAQLVVLGIAPVVLGIGLYGQALLPGLSELLFISNEPLQGIDWVVAPALTLVTVGLLLLCGYAMGRLLLSGLKWFLIRSLSPANTIVARQLHQHTGSLTRILAAIFLVGFLQTFVIWQASGVNPLAVTVIGDAIQVWPSAHYPDAPLIYGRALPFAVVLFVFVAAMLAIAVLAAAVEQLVLSRNTWASLVVHGVAPSTIRQQWGRHLTWFCVTPLGLGALAWYAVLAGSQLTDGVWPKQLPVIVLLGALGFVLIVAQGYVLARLLRRALHRQVLEVADPAHLRVA